MNKVHLETFLASSNSALAAATTISLQAAGASPETTRNFSQAAAGASDIALSAAASKAHAPPVPKSNLPPLEGKAPTATPR
jgi:hypothetical protein